MSIETVKAFVATCDGCGANFEDDSQDFTIVFMSREEMIEALNDYEWTIINGRKRWNSQPHKCYCPDCKPKES